MNASSACVIEGAKLVINLQLQEFRLLVVTDNYIDLHKLKICDSLYQQSGLNSARGRVPGHAILDLDGHFERIDPHTTTVTIEEAQELCNAEPVHTAHNNKTSTDHSLTRTFVTRTRISIEEMQHAENYCR